MILKEVIDKTDFSNVWMYLTSIYDDLDDDRSKSAYNSVFEELKNIKPIKSKMKIIIKYVQDDNYIGWTVDGIEDDVTYALDFTPRNVLAGMEIDVKTLDILKLHEIVAHCLWEMTFYSFDEEEIQAKSAELKETADEYRTELIR